MDTTQDWTATRISYLKALKTPSDAQRVLVQLYELPQRSSKQDRELATLLKLEKINEKAEAARQAAHRILHEKRILDRKEREHRLIQVGALTEIASIDRLDRGVLLGAFLHLAEQLAGDHAGTLGQQFKFRGDALLKQREAARSKTAANA